MTSFRDVSPIEDCLYRYTCRLVSKEKILLDTVESVSYLISTLNPASPASKPGAARSPLAEVGGSLEKAKCLLSYCVQQSVRSLSLQEYSYTGLYRNLAAWKGRGYIFSFFLPFLNFSPPFIS